jgi:hypothetical protein
MLFIFVQYSILVLVFIDSRSSDHERRSDIKEERDQQRGKGWTS